MKVTGTHNKAVLFALSFQREREVKEQRKLLQQQMAAVEAGLRDQQQLGWRRMETSPHSNGTLSTRPDCLCMCAYHMYVCMYVRMYVCMNVCMNVCTYVCMYVCMYIMYVVGYMCV